MLVTIASYGVGQDHFLREVVARYRELGWPCRIVVLSNVDKKVDGAETRVGLPARNPYSLPFAHRTVMAENAGKFDLYVYAEDDTPITRRNLEAYLALQPQLGDDEILGFMRFETRPDGSRVVVTANHHFRWLPQSVTRRGNGLFAQFSNEHSGCFVATRQHLDRALSSGGFLVAPASRRYGMLETAASDIYTQCGLRRLLSLGRLHDFIVPHLANKYHDRMGIPIEELDAQVEVLRRSSDDEAFWKGSLFDPATRAPHFRWSRNLYDEADVSLLPRVVAAGRKLLTVGATTGANERWLSSQGAEVTAIPLDAVFGARLQASGFTVVQGSLPDALRKLQGERFDGVLLADVLHLVESPVDWLGRLREVLAAHGRIIARVPQAPNLAYRVRDVLEGSPSRAPSFRREGVHSTSPGRIRAWCKAAGLDVANCTAEYREAPAAGGGLRSALRRRIRERLVFEARLRANG